ncbi:MAG: hypothetical protein LBF64_00160 [Oscillospiraceae bacterium]|jgi:hypothetical protein|nr:hypothetical protein [Oscillospiraceae bacterium]
MRIDASMPPAARTPPNAAAQEHSPAASVGDVLEAEVLTASGRQLTLRLPDGAVLSARSETIFQASPGDTLWLTVSGQADGALLVKAADGRSDARSLLRQWKAGQTPQNVRLVSAMLNAGLPPAERLFRWLASALVSIPDITPEQAVFLRAHNIPLDKQSVSLLNRMSRQDLMLGRQLADLMDLLFPAAETAGHADTRGATPTAAIAPAPARAAAGPAASDVRGAPPGAVTCGDAADASPLPVQPAAWGGSAPGGAVHPEAISPHTAASLETEILSIFGRTAANPTGGAGLPGVVDIDTLRAMIYATASVPDSTGAPAQPETPGADAAATPAGAPTAEHIPADLARIVGTFGATGAAARAAGAAKIPETPGTNGPAGAKETTETDRPAPRAAAPSGAEPPPAERAAADATTPGILPVSKQAPSGTGAAAGSGSGMAADDSPSPANPPDGLPPPPDRENAPPLRAALAELFRDIRPGQADGLPRAMDADRLTRALLDALRAAGEEASARPPAERARAEATLRDIAAGVRFTQQLGNFATVVQWPVILNGQETTAELYIFGGDGARSRIDPKNATLFLSLSTAHMGRVEALVKVIGKHVECDFRLPSKEQADFVRAAAPKLGALLEGAGYRLTRSSSIQLLEPAAGPLAVAEAKAFFDRRYRFDRQA